MKERTERGGEIRRALTGGGVLSGAQMARCRSKLSTRSMLVLAIMTALCRQRRYEGKHSGSKFLYSVSTVEVSSYTA